MVSTQKKQGYHFIFQEKRCNFAPTSRGWKETVSPLENQEILKK